MDRRYDHIQPLGLDRWVLYGHQLLTFDPERAETDYPYTPNRHPPGSREWVEYLCRRRQFELDSHLIDIADSEGTLLSSFAVGYDIMDLQTTLSEEIWVSYGDQNAQGIVCFNERGEDPFHLFRDIPSKLFYRIHDCDAINVASGDEVWIYYYHDFPLMHLRERQVNAIWYGIPVKLARAFTVLDRQALFAIPQKDKHLLHLVDLITMKTEQLLPLDAQGEPILKVEYSTYKKHTTDIAQFRAFGRGSKLYLSTDAEHLYLINLADL